MRYILLLLWLVLGLVYFLLAKNTCDPNKEEIPVAAVDPMKIEVPCPPKDPYYFNWSSDKVIPTDSWAAYKNALLYDMKATSKLRITGMYVNKEINSTSFENLGIARAKAIAELIGLEEALYQFANDSIRNVKYSSDCGLQAGKIRLVTVSEKIKEIDDKTLIYFPVNSINKLADTEVEAYLDEVALRVMRTGEIIKLDGHTDNSGSEEYNWELGMSRAKIIKEYLVAKRVPIERIITESFGDTQAIESNETERGRAANRRTELRIIKQ